jgi:uncharacterized protein (TIGR03083 family)
MTLSPERYCAVIEQTTAGLASVVGSADPELPIPTCPDWTLRQLATHVGRAQRWATAITAARSAEFIEFRAVPDGKLPDEVAARGPWLTAGAARLVAAVADAGDDEVWAFGTLTPARFWARRMAHETTMHGADAKLAAGEQISIPADVAADGIDEWLTTMSGPLFGRPDPRPGALPPGRTMHVHATDAELGGAGEWVLSHDGDGITVRGGHEKADVALTGPAADLLLVLLRRRPASCDGVTVFGDEAVLSRWLEHTQF